MLTPNIAALTRCVTTRQVKEAVHLGSVLSDHQHLPTAKPPAPKIGRQPDTPQRESRDPKDPNVRRLNATLGNRSLNSI